MTRTLLVTGASKGIGRAIASLNKILELDPDDADAVALRAKLTQGDGTLPQTAATHVKADQAGLVLRD